MRNNGWFDNWKRRAVQAASLVILGEWSFYGIFRCPFAVPYIGCGNCPVIQCPGSYLWGWAWIVIFASALFMGRLFCGWVCPGGLAADLLGSLAFFRHKISPRVSALLGYGKYILLLVSLYVFFILHNPRWAVPIRTGDFFNSVGLTFEHASPIWIAKTSAILVIFALGVVVSHAWCRFFCPTGGALALFQKISLFRYGIDPACTDCDRCRKSCGQETRPSHENCTNCGDCRGVCPPGAISLHTPFGDLEMKAAAEKG